MSSLSFQKTAGGCLTCNTLYPIPVSSRYIYIYLSPLSIYIPLLIALLESPPEEKLSLASTTFDKIFWMHSSTWGLAPAYSLVTRGSSCGCIPALERAAGVTGLEENSFLSPPQASKVPVPSESLLCRGDPHVKQCCCAGTKRVTGQV